MAPFDYGVASLLCAEDKSVFDGGVEEEEVNFDMWNHRNPRNHNQNQKQRLNDGLDGLPLQSEEALASMLQRQNQHLPSADYLMRLRCGDLDFEARKGAIDWIQQVNAHFCFGPLCAYLSINYLDRFLSAYEIPKGKAWMLQLVSVVCVSLAAKMEETEVPLSLDLQMVNSKYVFEAKTIQRMELLVLSSLKWKMQAITPFSFLDCFTNKINDGNDDDSPPPRASGLMSMQLILNIIKGIDFLEFRPSEIAAAVAILASKETKTIDTEKAVSVLSQYVEKKGVVKCMNMIHEMALIGGSVRGGESASGASVPKSPIGVLDAACFSYRSNDTKVRSCAKSADGTPETKRRKLSRPCQVEL